MKTLLRTALLIATLASVALVIGALQSGAARAAPTSVCVTVPVINPVTGVLSCFDQFGNFLPVAPVQAPVELFPGCVTAPGGALFCRPGTTFTAQPQVVFFRAGQAQPLFFSTQFFRRCFVNIFGTLSCF